VGNRLQQTGTNSAARPSADCRTIIDDLSQEIPISARELEAIEAYLAALIDQLLDEMPANEGRND
jgi:hypothetical protein